MSARSGGGGEDLCPPGIARRVLVWAARRLETPDLPDDADELFADRAALDVGSARRWYRRQALAAVGRVVAQAAPRRFSWLAGLGIDAKLAGRMLAKYPGVSLVGGLAMTIGIGLGAGYLELVDDLLQPSLPFEEGDRIVGLRVWDVETNDLELRLMHDFAAWRGELTTVQELGAFRSIERNLAPAPDEPAELAIGAEITPSAFGTVRVSARFGRTLVEADAEAGAPSVMVLGYELWRARFAADPGVVGSTIRLGRDPVTVVGIMPEGFAFPMSHDYWVPLPARALREAEPGQGPPIQLFGRLAPGATLEAAGAELAALGQRAAADAPSTHAGLRPEVVPYPALFIDVMTGGGGGTGMYLVQLFFVGLLLVLASNVATMVFARTATRENEIAMRFAMGSSRGRILVQFFFEALLLALIATAIGLAVVGWGAAHVTRFVWDMTQGREPFWLDGALNARTVVYALALAVSAALVAGVVPAYKATGRGLQGRLRDAAGAGASFLRFGGIWSMMIVAQVALAVLILPPAILAVWSLTEPAYVDPGFAAGDYLSAELSLDRLDASAGRGGPPERRAEFEETYRELERRLLAEGRVTRVTFATHLPVMNHPQPWVEVQPAGDAPPSTWAMTTSVDPGFFEAFGAEITAGRRLDFTDLAPDARTVVVNEHFVDEILGGRNAVGRRVRYTTRYGERASTGRPTGLSDTEMREPGDWFEIVGVVRGLGMDTNRDLFFPGSGPGVYHALTPSATDAGDAFTVRLALHAGREAESFAPRFREIAHDVNAELRLSDVLPLDGPIDRANRGERMIARFTAGITAFVAALALLVSIAGTYSALAFTVSRQTREIGIRIALGADRRSIVAGVFSRAMLQIGLGIALGAGVWFYLIFFGIGGEDRIGLLFATVGLLVLVGLAACGVPVRRALRIEPTEALKEGG